MSRCLLIARDVRMKGIKLWSIYLERENKKERNFPKDKSLNERHHVTESFYFT